MKWFRPAAFFAVLSLACQAQVLLSTASFNGGSGGTDRTVVKGPSGLLHAVTVSDDPATSSRPVTVFTSSDGGATWSQAPAPLNDAGSGLTGANPANWCAMTIDSTGLLHCIWGGYYYPTSYRQWYATYDPIANIRSPILYVTGMVGASTGSSTIAQDIHVDQSDTVWMVSQGTSGSWREHLLRSTAPQAAGQTFTNLGPISSSASAQTSRLTIDSLGRVHASYYRNISPGQYFHRLYDPATSSWVSETVLGNTTGGQDNYGQLCADNMGNVHAVYVVDSNTTTNWGYRYKRFDPVNGWQPEVILADVPGANFSGIANYRIFGMACDEVTGLVYLLFRDLNNGGGLILMTKDLASPTFQAVNQLAPNTTNLHAYINPSIRGTLYPAFNNTGTDLHFAWGQRNEDTTVTPSTVTWEWVFQSAGGSPPSGATLTKLSPLTPGAVSALALNSASDPSLAYVCGFAASDTPGIPLPGGGTVGLAFDPLLELSLTPGNGIFFNNVGWLDPVGAASVTIAVPNFPPLTGLTIYGAFVVEDPVNPGNAGTISPTLPMVIQ